MAAVDRRHGKDGQIMMDAAGGGAPVLVADMNMWSLDMTRDRVDVTCFGDTNKVRRAGLPDFSGTFGGQWAKSSSPALFDVVLAGTAATLRLVPDANDPTYYFQGLANIDGNVNVDNTGSVKTGGKWDAADNWTMAP